MRHLKYRQDKNCLNCGETVGLKFCPQCGQENLEYRDNFFHMVVHVVGDFFHFDSKFFRSIIPLFTKPGFLTKEYLEGRRVRYIQPLRLFFFSTIVMVIIANIYYKKFETLIKDDKVTITENEHPDQKQKLSSTDLEKMDTSQKKLILRISSGLDAMTHNLKYISFFLLPVYALFFKMLYRKSQRYYVDHLIYVLHVQSFAYIVLIFLFFIPLFIAPPSREWFLKALLVITVIYMAMSLRYLYKQSWVKTIAKTLIAGFLILTVSVLVVGGFILAAFIF